MQPVNVSKMRIKILAEDDSRHHVLWNFKEISDSTLYLTEPIKVDSFPETVKISLYLGGVVDKWQKYELRKIQPEFDSNKKTIEAINFEVSDEEKSSFKRDFLLARC